MHQLAALCPALSN